MPSDYDADLICPITLELFRDPVLAEDGHLYERTAITQWINEHGTSPLTREVLNVNYLQPDDEVRRRADQRRKSSIKHTVLSPSIPPPPPPPKPRVIPTHVHRRKENPRIYAHKHRNILHTMDGCCDFISETCEKWFMCAFR